MTTDLHKGVLSQSLLKMTESSNACQSFNITAKAFKLFGIICRVMYVLKK